MTRLSSRDREKPNIIRDRVIRVTMPDGRERDAYATECTCRQRIAIEVKWNESRIVICEQCSSVWE